MKMSCVRCIGIAVLSLLPGSALALATDGASSSIVFPLVAKTSSFETEVFVQNPNAQAISIDVLYYEANNLPSPGLKSCTFLSLPAFSTTSFTLGAQCTSLGAGSHFGLLVLRDRAAQKINVFYAYSRVQHVSTRQGFSVEGFPENVFSGREGWVVGAKRIAASVPPTQAQPGYQTNCFVASLGEGFSYRIRLHLATDNTEIASIPDAALPAATLGPYQIVRYLDVFEQAGLPPGDLANIVVSFNNTDPAGTEPAVIGYCTLQDNLSLGADFRIAKSIDAFNNTQRKLRCRGVSDAACTTLTVPATFEIPNAGTKLVFSMFLNHPDFLRCDIVGPSAAQLEMRLHGPDGAVVAGGNDLSTFYYATGPRNSVAGTNGTQAFWSLDVSPREGTPPAFPAGFGLKCQSGSGIHLSNAPSGAADDF
jgi:hypothetical protein